MKDTAQHFFETLQDIITGRLEATDGGATFREDRWEHATGGGGRTRVIENGAVFEKGGVNTSAVTSMLSERLAAAMKVERQELFATGISLVLHPVSPLVPTIHMNLRYLELANGDSWFGGGVDLTPWYLFDEDARHLHTMLKSICYSHPVADYSRFKTWCDEYFLIKHRGETRGIGGIFFDYLRTDTVQTFDFIRDLGVSFPGIYLPIVERHKDAPWTPEQKHWQRIRRGRYVEFNLVYDRGTIFGLETGGRTESILMSLPPEVSWVYDHTPAANSPEARLLSILRNPQSWI